MIARVPLWNWLFTGWSWRMLLSCLARPCLCQWLWLEIIQQSFFQIATRERRCHTGQGRSANNAKTTELLCRCFLWFHPCLVYFEGISRIVFHDFGRSFSWIPVWWAWHLFLWTRQSYLKADSVHKNDFQYILVTHTHTEHSVDGITPSGGIAEDMMMCPWPTTMIAWSSAYQDVASNVDTCI